MNKAVAIYLVTLFVYFIVLMLVSAWVSKGANLYAAFIAEKKSRWWMVAFGMTGASMSGLTFLSIPGKAKNNDFSYMQLVVGYFIGYWIITFFLLPLYYKYNVTSIYSYLRIRFGKVTHKTGAIIFLISRTIGASIRIYIVLNVVQQFLCEPLGIHFGLTTASALFLIFMYTVNGGVKAIVLTDVINTAMMLGSLFVCMGFLSVTLNFSLGEFKSLIWSNLSKNTFHVSDWREGHYFLKDIIGGAFLIISTSGLNQELMQKNISVERRWDSQKGVLLHSVFNIFLNISFLTLGVLLYTSMQRQGISEEVSGDLVFSTVALNHVKPIIGIVFLLGLLSALLPSADGAITALTSCICIDILGFEENTEYNNLRKNVWRKKIHLGISIAFFFIVTLYRFHIGNKAAIDAFIDAAAYTCSPLLGIFALGMFTQRGLREKFVIPICIISPLLCFFITSILQNTMGYIVGRELFFINGLVTFIGLLIVSSQKTNKAF